MKYSYDLFEVNELLGEIQDIIDTLTDIADELEYSKYVGAAKYIYRARNAIQDGYDEAIRDINLGKERKYMK